MKKHFLVLMALMVSVFAFAGNEIKPDSPNVENTTSVKAVNGYVELYKVEVDSEDITLPFVVRVPAPSESILGISGPVVPNITNWNVSGGILTITYTREMEIWELRDGGTFYIEVATSPMPTQGNNYGYAIKLVVK